MSHLAEKPVKEDWYPVHIFHNAVVTNDTLNGVWNGSGTALMKDGEPQWVVTAAHCFNKDGIYHIVIITPKLSQAIWGVENVERTTPTNDVAMARISANAQRIKSISSDTNVNRNFEAYVSRLKKTIPTRSLVTGKTHNIIGLMQVKKGSYYYILDYDVVKAESGAAFDAGDQVFIINKYVVLDIEQQRSLDIDPRGGYFTLVTGASLKWP